MPYGLHPCTCQYSARQARCTSIKLSCIVPSEQPVAPNPCFRNEHRALDVLPVPSPSISEVSGHGTFWVEPKPGRSCSLGDGTTLTKDTLQGQAHAACTCTGRGSTPTHTKQLCRLGLPPGSMHRPPHSAQARPAPCQPTTDKQQPSSRHRCTRPHWTRNSPTPTPKNEVRYPKVRQSWTLPWHWSRPPPSSGCGTAATAAAPCRG